MWKDVVETQGPQLTIEYSARALHAGLARLHELMRMHTPTRPRTHMHARTRTHAHRSINNTYLFPTTTINRERAALLLYTYIGPLVNYAKYSTRYSVTWKAIFYFLKAVIMESIITRKLKQ